MEPTSPTSPFVPPGRPAPLRVWIVPHATVFVSSACVMVIELVAGRIVSRHLGASLYTWTSVIGVILGGLALGNYVGGRLADRYPPRRILGTLFLTSAVTCVAIIALNRIVGGWSLLWELAWPTRVAAHVGIVFFLPAAFLGTIGPVAARMALGLGRGPGHTLGSVYAWGVVGSLVGTFATGYFLIAVMDTGTILWTVASLLALAGLGYLPRSPRAWTAVGMVGLSCGLAHAGWDWSRGAAEAVALRAPSDPDVIYSDESRYSHIEVRRLDATSNRLGLYLDRLLHSQLSRNDPLDLHYGYARIFAGVTHALARERPRLRTLTIGGGGYVFPRYLEATWPGSDVEVVEIDPAVTRAAQRALGLPETTSIVSHHQDGRVFVNTLRERSRRGEPFSPYDFVYVDAVNDYSVPHQLTTREFFATVAALLAPDGRLLVNFIDLVDSGRMLGALAATVGEVFPHVEVLALDNFERMAPRSRVTFVLVAGLEPFGAALEGRRADFVRLDRAIVRLYEERVAGLVLTDDHAPVEQLIAPVVRAAAGEFAAGATLRRALRHARRGESEAFVEQCREALRIDPDFSEAHYNLGVGLYTSGRRDEAVTHWLRAIALDPDHAEAHVNLGAARYEAGRLDEAERYLARAVRLRPDLAAARNALGIVLEARGDLDGALRNYREALVLAPNLGETRAHLERVRSRAGREGSETTEGS